MSEIIVLDTHIWFWWINLEFDRFPLQWKEKIETSRLTSEDIKACLAFAADREKKLFISSL